MRNLFYALLSFVALSTACKKEEVIEYKVLPLSKTFSLEIDQVINDSTINLKWDKYNGNDFKKYHLYRVAKEYKNGKIENTLTLIKEFLSVDELTYEERNMPFSNEISYNLNVQTTNPQKIISASKTHYRTTAYNSMIINHAQINKEIKQIYLTDFERGRIVTYNYQTNKINKSITLNKNIGYIATANYNGEPEVYVPSDDGWLLILDGNTLSQKDRIYVGGTRLTSVLYLNNKLVISTSDKTFKVFYDNSIKIYNRADKKLIGYTGYYANTRLLHLENSNYDLIDITTNIIPTQLSGYNLAADASPIKMFEDNYHGDHIMEASIVKSFPLGDKFITSSYGNIFNKNLVFDKKLSTVDYLNSYTDFEFNQDGTIIYAGLNSQNKINEIRYSNLNVNRSIGTKLPPAYLFRDQNQLIAVSKELVFGSAMPTIFFVEKFDL